MLSFSSNSSTRKPHLHQAMAVSIFSNYSNFSLQSGKIISLIEKWSLVKNWPPQRLTNDCNPTIVTCNNFLQISSQIVSMATTNQYDEPCSEILQCEHFHSLWYTCEQCPEECVRQHIQLLGQSRIVSEKHATCGQACLQSETHTSNYRKGTAECLRRPAVGSNTNGVQ